MVNVYEVEHANLLRSGVPAVHVPLPVYTLVMGTTIFRVLYLEHCGDVIPLLKGVLTASKFLPFSSHCHIKPASGLMFCKQSCARPSHCRTIPPTESHESTAKSDEEWAAA